MTLTLQPIPNPIESYSDASNLSLLLLTSHGTKVKLWPQTVQMPPKTTALMFSMASYKGKLQKQTNNQFLFSINVHVEWRASRTYMSPNRAIIK